MWKQSHQNRLIYEREKVKVSEVFSDQAGPCDAHRTLKSNQAYNSDLRAQETHTH